MLPGPVLARCGPGRSRSMHRSPLLPPPPLALGWLRPPRLHDVERVELVDRGLDAREHGTRARPRACTRALFWVENTPTEHRHRCYRQCCYLCNQRANEPKHVTRSLRSRGRIRRAVEAARPGPSLHFVHGFGLGSHSQLLLPDVSVGELYLYRVRTAKQIGRPAPRAEVDPQVSAVGPALHGPLLAILVGPGNRHELSRL